MTPFTPEQIVEILAKTGSEEWNNSIAKRAPQISQFLKSEEWVNGISPYLKSLVGNSIAKLMNETIPMEGVHYLRGFCKALQIVLQLTTAIENQIVIAEKNEELKKS